MNILYVCGDDPRLSNFGSQQRTHFLWESLRRFADVYTVVRGEKKCDECVLDEANHVARIRFLPDLPIIRFLDRVFTKFFKPASFPFRTLGFAERRIPYAWRGIKFDVVVTRYIYCAAQTGFWHLAPCVIDIDDAPLQSFDTVMKARIPWGLRAVRRWMVAAYQNFIIGKCDAVWIPDRSQVDSFCKIAPCFYLPNIANPPSEGYSSVKNISLSSRQLMSVGILDYAPNVKGIQWFLDTIWPAVHLKHPELTYCICGGHLDQHVATKWQQIPGVVVAGYVSDIDKVYEDSIGVIAPVLTGAGTCIKVMEACLRGRKVFATPFAARGYNKTEIMNMGIELFMSIDEFEMSLQRWLCTRQDKQKVEQERIMDMAGSTMSLEGFSQIVEMTIRKCSNA